MSAGVKTRHRVGRSVAFVIAAAGLLCVVAVVSYPLFGLARYGLRHKMQPLRSAGLVVRESAEIHGAGPLQSLVVVGGLDTRRWQDLNQNHWYPPPTVTAARFHHGGTWTLLQTDTTGTYTYRLDTDTTSHSSSPVTTLQGASNTILLTPYPEGDREGVLSVGLNVEMSTAGGYTLWSTPLGLHHTEMVAATVHPMGADEDGRQLVAVLGRAMSEVVILDGSTGDIVTRIARARDSLAVVVPPAHGYPARVALLEQGGNELRLVAPDGTEDARHALAAPYSSAQLMWAIRRADGGLRVIVFPSYLAREFQYVLDPPALASGERVAPLMDADGGFLSPMATDLPPIYLAWYAPIEYPVFPAGRHGYVTMLDNWTLALIAPEGDRLQLAQVLPVNDEVVPWIGMPVYDEQTDSIFVPVGVTLPKALLLVRYPLGGQRWGPRD